MKNRFKLNENEKNRIKGLHGIKEQRFILTEQKELGWKIADNGKKYGTDNPGSMTQEWFDGLRDAAEAEVAGLGLKGKTINLYKPDEDGHETSDVVGKYRVEEITLNDENSGIKIKFVDVGGEDIIVDWNCGDTKYANAGMEQMKVGHGESLRPFLIIKNGLS